MRPQGHIAASLLVWSLASDDPREIPLAVLAGSLPDLDREIVRVVRLAERAVGKTPRPPSPYDHHQWASHCPPLVLLPAVAALVLGHRAGYGRQAGMVVSALTSHLALDILADGLRLNPANRRKHGWYLDTTDIVFEYRRWLLDPWPQTPMGRVERGMLFLAAVITFLRQHS